MVGKATDCQEDTCVKKSKLHILLFLIASLK